MKTDFSRNTTQFNIQVAAESDLKYVKAISQLIEQVARIRNTGIARRSPEYIAEKMQEGKAIIATHSDGRLAGFCYIETWTHGKYVANSGLIVAPEFQNCGLGKKIKHAAFELSRKRYSNARIFSITTSPSVMKMNTDLGYRPVPFSELTTDDAFWASCQTCPNYDILMRNERKNCLCTGLIYTPSPSTASQKQTAREVVVLAFSGGLDTSYCAKYLTDVKGMDVHSAIVNTGGFSSAELADIEARAYQLGVKQHVVLEQTAEYYQQCLKYLIFGNVLKNDTYPLSVSSERVFQAMAIANYAREIKAQYIAHGSTGAGNDQIRFDVIFNILASEIGILTPIRDLKLSRESEIEFLKAHGQHQDWQKARYSVNKGLWGTTVGGKETLTSDQYLPEAAFPTSLSKTTPETLRLHFEKGEFNGIDETVYENPVEAIQQLTTLAAPFAIGRDIHVGDTIIGIKGRVGFEAPAPLILIKAHQALEKHVLTKWQLYWKGQLGDWYGSMLHEGQFLSPVMRNIETFLEDTQENITGTISVLLAPYRFQVLGIQSPYDLMNTEAAQYGEMNNAWHGEDVKGFSRMLANQTMIYHRLHGINPGSPGVQSQKRSEK